MSVTFSQRPGPFNLEFVRGDDFPVTLDFSTSLTGVTLTASITSIVTGSVVLPLTVNVTDAANGIASFTITKAQTAALARGTYSWSVTSTQGGITRTPFQGFVEVL